MDYDALLLDSKRLILDTALASELNVLVDDLNVIRPRARRRGRNSEQPVQTQALDVRFNMSGYLKS